LFAAVVGPAGPVTTGDSTFSSSILFSSIIVFLGTPACAGTFASPGTAPHLYLLLLVML
jgi:hypothetical protein